MAHSTISTQRRMSRAIQPSPRRRITLYGIARPSHFTQGIHSKEPLPVYSPQLPALVAHPQPHRRLLARQFKQERYAPQAALGRELVF